MKKTTRTVRADRREVGARARTRDEAALLVKYRNCTRQGRAAIRAALRALATP